ncbi:MAG: DUF131 domain-containing protein [Candidatus Micrarchaeota archaeon]|nr:DUF131 domain-containing protein [Candidatus Micrarchaeota archaeon]
MNTEVLVTLGLILIIAGFIVLLAAGLKGETRFAFGGFIGPVPFGFANDQKLLWIVILVITIALLVLYLRP